MGFGKWNKKDASKDADVTTTEEEQQSPTTTDATINVNAISAPETTPEEFAAERSDLAKKYRSTTATNNNIDTVDSVAEEEPVAAKEEDEDNVLVQATPTAPTKNNTTSSTTTKSSSSNGKSGMILEAAFVDPAYTWPPMEGQGKNAIELQASIRLLDGGDDDDNASKDTNDSLNTTESQKRRLQMPEKPLGQKITTTTIKSRGIFGNCCCRKKTVEESIVTDAEQLQLYQERKQQVEALRKLHLQQKKEKLRTKEKQYRMKHKYNRIPEGILLYRLDTSTGILELMSPPNNLTNTETLVTSLKIAAASPSPNKSRRGLDLVGYKVREDGTMATTSTTATLIACEQRTATAWLEALSIMFAKKGYHAHGGGGTTSILKKVRACVCQKGMKWKGCYALLYLFISEYVLPSFVLGITHALTHSLDIILSFLFQ